MRDQETPTEKLLTAEFNLFGRKFSVAACDIVEPREEGERMPGKAYSYADDKGLLALAEHPPKVKTNRAVWDQVRDALSERLVDLGNEMDIVLPLTIEALSVAAVKLQQMKHTMKFVGLQIGTNGRSGVQGKAFFIGGGEVVQIKGNDSSIHRLTGSREFAEKYLLGNNKTAQYEAKILQGLSEGDKLIMFSPAGSYELRVATSAVTDRERAENLKSLVKKHFLGSATAAEACRSLVHKLRDHKPTSGRLQVVFIEKATYEQPQPTIQKDHPSIEVT